MAWLAVDKYKTECIYSVRPFRGKSAFELPYDKNYDDNGLPEYNIHGQCIILPKGTIQKIIGYELTWENDPVEIR